LKSTLLLIMAMMVSGSAAEASYWVNLSIAENGVSKYVIAAADKQIPSEITACKELQTYIAKSSGVTLPIIKESELRPRSRAIFVGQTETARSAGIIPKGPEQWVIKTMDNCLLLTGGRPRGTLYAVYHFLEDLVGIHWWTIWDETVPKHAVLSFGALNLSGQPSFYSREIYDGVMPWPKEFYPRNRVNGCYSLTPWEYGGTLRYGPPDQAHTCSMYFPPAKYFGTHPEYYALIDGKRSPNGQLCLTNKDLINECIAKVKESIRTSYAESDSKGIPHPVFYALSQNDTKGNCKCDSCKAVYEKENASGLSLSFVNAVADGVEKEYPEVLIDTLAYWFYQEAPKTIKPRDNVRIRLCDMDEDIMHSIIHKNNKNGLRRLGDWSKITKHLNIWKYGVIYSPNLPTPSMLNAADDVQTYKKYGVEGIFTELENIMTTDMWEMKAWMLAKLYENPYLDTETLAKTFTDGYYGPAGKYINEYIHLVHKALDEKPDSLNFGGNPSGYSFMTLDMVRKCNKLFDEAEAAVANNPALLDRVQLTRTSLDRTIAYRSVELFREYNKTGKKGDYGLSVEKSIKRASAIIRKMTDTRFAGLSGYVQYAYDQATALDRLITFSKPVPIPAQFANLPVDSVYDCSPVYFRLSGVNIVDDPTAAYGATAKLDIASAGADASKYYITPTQGMPMGFYNVGDKTFGKITNLLPGDIKPGYNFYKLGPAKFKPQEYFYLFWSWVIQADLGFAMNDNPDQEYEVYASIKFEGPSFPTGDPTKPDAILVDRLIVVQVKGK